jgi:lipopolysaccharide heptosyltransferase II
LRVSWQAASEVLCIRLDGAGDVLMTSPALRALRESKPGRRLTLLTSEAGAVAARRIPEVDDVIAFRAPWMKPASAGPAGDHALVAELAARCFDAAAIFTVYSQSPLPAAYLCRLAGVPLTLAHCRENPYELLTNWVPDPEPQRQVRHEVRRQLELVSTVGCRPSTERLSFAVGAQARRRVARLLTAAGTDFNRPLVVVHPGASAASRRYPADRFARALEQLFERTRCCIVLTGDAGEADLVAGIQSATGAPLHSLAGRLDLEELGALLARADVAISNNTAPAHIAAAVGTPVVDLYALTNPQHTPWQVEHRVLYHDVPCRYCYKSVCPMGHHDCLRSVPPAAVAAAAIELLAPSLRAARTRTLPPLRSDNGAIEVSA